MEPSYITLSPRDPEFVKHMNGDLGDGRLALPVESFSIASLRERITFRIVAKADRPRPTWIRLFIGLARLELLPITWAPALTVLLTLPRELLLRDLLGASLALLSLFCLHASAFALNDYNDHWTGPDRIQRKRGSQVIQKGWLSARNVQKSGWALLLGGGILGAPLWIREPLVMTLFALLGCFAIVGFSFAGRGFKSLGLGELVVFFSLGPFLTVGLAEAMGATASWRWTPLGMSFGLWTVILLQVRQLETLLSEREVRSGTLISRLGFDRSKVWLRWMLLVAPLLLPASWGWLTGEWLSAIVISIVGLTINGPLFLRLGRAASPLSSDLWMLSRKVLVRLLLVSMMIITASLLWVR